MAEQITTAAAGTISPLSRRGLLSGATALAVAAYLAGPRPARAANYKFGLSLGWTAGESGRHFSYGYSDSLTKLGGTAMVTDANWDPRKQITHIESMVAANVDAIMLTSSASVVIAPAVQRALAAGIPVFASDSLITGVPVTSTALSDNFGMGYYTAVWMAKKLRGKGKVAIITLPQNETWDERTFGMRFAFSQYPGISIVGSWSFAHAGHATPKDAVAGLLSQHADLDAIWCAWDGAGSDGAEVIQKAGRTNVFLTSIDGGTETFNYVKSGSPLKLCLAQSFYEEAYLNVLYAHQLLSGQKVPRLVLTPVYAVTEDMLQKQPMTVYDTYDQPGEAEALGWTRVL
ncbi:MAG: sugar ABC transporter substrate-binding protein [Proteobacteria bacterium]|nr:sugar ABC transporter substrate-binding protein [Pseudomonadota bacterium]